MLTRLSLPSVECINFHQRLDGRVFVSGVISEVTPHVDASLDHFVLLDDNNIINRFFQHFFLKIIILFIHS